jgi:hypothetical protein
MQERRKVSQSLLLESPIVLLMKYRVAAILWEIGVSRQLNPVVYLDYRASF